MQRIVLFSHHNPDAVPPQSILLQQMLEAEGYVTILIGRGKTGLGRLFDVVWRGFYWMFRANVALVDVFGHRAFIYEAIAILYGRLFGRRVVAMLRGGWMHDFIRHWPTLTHWVLRNADVLLSPHGFLSEKLSATGLQVDLIIPNIIDHKAYHYRERMALKPKFIYLRGTHPLYNPEMCLRAFGIIQARYPEASLTFAAGGPLNDCKSLADELNLRNVCFSGLVAKDEIPRLVDQHDIYFQANRVENMPVTILEMWASGVPVVGTSVGGMPYLVHHEEDGLLVPTEDHEALAAACCRLLEEKDLALKLVRNARVRVHEFSWEKVRGRWAHALQLESPVAAIKVA